MDNKNTNDNNWNNTKNNKWSKNILVLIVILLICLCIGIMYQNILTNKSNISDEEYIKAKEEFQKELEEKRQNYTFHEKLIYGEKINIAIINSSIRNKDTANFYPFNTLYTYIRKYNSNSNIYEFNSINLENINNLINETDNNENNQNSNLIKSCNLFLISFNKYAEDYDIQDLKNLIENIQYLNDKNIIFITVETGENETKINKLKDISDDKNIYFMDMRKDLLDSENTDIEIIKNNGFTESKKSTLYCNLIKDKIEELN